MPAPERTETTADEECPDCGLASYGCRACGGWRCDCAHECQGVA